MSISLGIIYICLSFLLLLSSILIAKISFKDSIDKFSIKNIYPSEAFTFKNGYVFIIYCFVNLLIIPFIMSIKDNILVISQTNNFYILLIFVIVSYISLFLMVFIYPIQINFKYHIVFFTISYTTQLMCSLVELFICFRINNIYVLNIFTFLIGLIVLNSNLTIMNPKLSKWFKLDSKTNENGEILTSRPKIIHLAFGEWMGILLNLLSNFIFVLDLILVIVLN